MPGLQLGFSIRGERYEKAFDAIASGFLSVVRVPRADDYGIDAYCHVLLPFDATSFNVGGTFGVQVRGPGRRLQFGGVNRNGVWKAYEIEWLRSLAVPLYLARVAKDCSRVDFYSLWPVWQILGGSKEPFRIICELDDASNKPFHLPRLAGERDGSHGDRNTYKVPLGPPFLSASHEQLKDNAFNRCATALMSKWIRFDRSIVTRLLLRIFNFEGVGEWRTNDCNFTGGVPKRAWMGWDTNPGENIDDICEIFEPVVTNLGTHLQQQDDPAAYNLIPALEWLRSNGRLSRFGEGLLEGLRTTKADGKSPRPG